MTRDSLKKRILIASHAHAADLVIKNCHVVNVFTHRIQEADIAFCDGIIAGVGRYDGVEEYDAQGAYALPGLIDSHIHIESSFVTPEEFGRLAVPHGTTTVISDPHEIVNVCGVEGLDYMLKAAERTALDILYMVPSCVPCTEWECSGAKVDAEMMRSALQHTGVLGIGELMNAPGVLKLDDEVLSKILMATDENAVIDGHAPGADADELSGYMAAGIRTDHECGSVDEMKSRLDGGMYVMLRYGSACRELPTLLRGVTPENSRRCLLCSDDRQSLDLLEKGDIDDCLRVCVRGGLDPVTAVQMATLNAAECYGLHDRGAIAPGRRADVILVDNLTDFTVEKVFIEGRLCAEDGRYILPTERQAPGKVSNTVHVADFSVEKLSMQLHCDTVHVIDIIPDTVLTKDGIAQIDLDADGEFRFNEANDVARISVIERHHMTGHVMNAFIRGYGIRKGAIALSVGHDSHNILTVGVNKAEMACAVEKLIEQKGGVVAVKDGEVLESLPLPIAGLMSDLPAEEVRDRLSRIEACAVEVLGVNADIDPLVTLCFMSLPVIPDLKITDKGLFDVRHQRFINVEI